LQRDRRNNGTLDDGGLRQLKSQATRQKHLNVRKDCTKNTFFTNDHISLQKNKLSNLQSCRAFQQNVQRFCILERDRMVIFGGLWGNYHTTTTTTSSSEYSSNVSSHQEASLSCLPIDDNDKEDNENLSSSGRIDNSNDTHASVERASFLSTGSTSSNAILQRGEVGDYGATGEINDYNTSRKNHSNSNNNNNNNPNPQQAQAPAAAASLRYDPNAESPSWTLGDFSETTLDVFHLCAVNLTIYILIAVIAFSYVFESWTIIDSIYFAVNTFTTVGKLSIEMFALVCVFCVCLFMCFIPNHHESYAHLSCGSFTLCLLLCGCHAMPCCAFCQ
jgi:hypothetical protein